MRYIADISNEYGRIKSEIELSDTPYYLNANKMSSIQKGSYLKIKDVEYFIDAVMTDLEKKEVRIKLRKENIGYKR